MHLCLPRTDTFRLSGSQVQQHISKIDINSIKKKKATNLRSPIHLEAVIYLWSHTQTANIHTQSLGVLQNISPRAHPICQGNAVICDFIGGNCIPPFPLLAPFLYLLDLQVYFGCLCVFGEVRVLALAVLWSRCRYFLLPCGGWV